MFPDVTLGVEALVRGLSERYESNPFRPVSAQDRLARFLLGLSAPVAANSIVDKDQDPVSRPPEQQAVVIPIGEAPSAHHRPPPTHPPGNAA